MTYEELLAIMSTINMTRDKSELEDIIIGLQREKEDIQEEINNQSDCFVDTHDELEHLENLIELGKKRLEMLK